MTLLSWPTVLAISVVFYVFGDSVLLSGYSHRLIDGKVEREGKCEGEGEIERLMKMVCWVGR